MHPHTYHHYCMQILSDGPTYYLISSPNPSQQPITTSNSAQLNNLPAFINNGYFKLKCILVEHGLLFTAKRYNNDKKTGELTKLAKSLLQLRYSEHLRPTANFYLTMKMHKPTLSGRPIVNCRYTMTYHASIYLDNILKPIVKLLPTVVHNTTEVLLQLDKLVIEPYDVIYCADVENLYPSIPHDFGLKAVKEILTRYKVSNIEFILQLLLWVLTNNYISYNDQVYLQRQGTAMGTPCAPNYANIVLYYVELKLFSQGLDVTYKKYFRYLDDLCVIFRSYHLARSFNLAFNQTFGHFKLNWVNSTTPKYGVFLDLTIRLGNRVTTSLYQKPTNKYLYIPTTTAHHQHIIINFIRNELNRYKLYCSDPADEQCCRHLFLDRLLRRGYKRDFLLQIYRTPLDPRQLQLHNLRRRNTTQKRINSKTPIFITQLPTLPPDQLRYIKQCVTIPVSLRKHPYMSNVYDIPTGKPIVSHRLGKNLSYLLTHKRNSKRKTTESDEANFDTGDPNPKRTRTDPPCDTR